MNAGDLRTALLALARRALFGWARLLAHVRRLGHHDAALPVEAPPEPPDAVPQVDQPPAHWLALVRRDPPAHWIERVQRDAPELLEPGRVPLVTVQPPPAQSFAQSPAGERSLPRPVVPPEPSQSPSSRSSSARQRVMAPIAPEWARRAAPMGQKSPKANPIGERADQLRAREPRPTRDARRIRKAVVAKQKPKPLRKRQPTPAHAPARQRRARLEELVAGPSSSHRVAALTRTVGRRVKRTIAPPLAPVRTRWLAPTIDTSRRVDSTRFPRLEPVVPPRQRPRQTLHPELEQGAILQHMEKPPTTITRPRRRKLQAGAPAASVTVATAPVTNVIVPREQDDPWPTLLPSHEAPIEDVATSLQTWSHLQRLDREQRGMSWSA